jgi:hypothetical protein
MPKIEVDDEVFRYLESQARPFEEPSPNHVLRRLLGLDTSATEKSGEVFRVFRNESPSIDHEISRMLAEVREDEVVRGKAPKTDLTRLVGKGMLSEGQTVYFRDYRERIHREVSAQIEGSGLRIGGKRLAMSAAAREVFNRLGFDAKSVRGPAHWCTEDGTTIQQLWERYLAEHTV